MPLAPDSSQWDYPNPLHPGANGDGSSSQVLAILVGGLAGVPGSCNSPGLTLAYVGIWVDQAVLSIK